MRGWLEKSVDRKERKHCFCPKSDPENMLISFPLFVCFVLCDQDQDANV